MTLKYKIISTILFFDKIKLCSTLYELNNLKLKIYKLILKETLSKLCERDYERILIDLPCRTNT